MEKNATREALAERLDVEELKHDIRRLTSEVFRHKARTAIYAETLKAQKAELNAVLESNQQHLSDEGIYR